MVNKTSLSLLLLFVSFVALTSCTNMQRAGYGKKQTRSDSNIPQQRKINYRISALPLGYYHNKIKLYKLGCVLTDSSNVIENKPLDSIAYRDYLLEHSIHNTELACLLKKSGMMRIDSIIYGVNVLKLYISHDTNKYMVYSVVSDEKETKKIKGWKEYITEGATYYFEMTPYFDPRKEDYHNRGMYLNGIVIRDYDIPIEECMNLYTTKNLSGYYYIYH